MKHPTVLSISEHWCSETQMEYMVLPGYRIAASYCRPSRRHGGAAIYLKNNCNFLPIRDISKISTEMHYEICGIYLKTNNSKICILNIYRPPTGDFNLFLNILSHVLHKYA